MSSTPSSKDRGSRAASDSTSRAAAVSASVSTASAAPASRSRRLQPWHWAAIHAGVLAAALACAAYVSSEPEVPARHGRADVTVWKGSAEDVQRIEYVSKRRKIVLESHTDATGRWFEGTVTKYPAVTRATQSATAENAPSEPSAALTHESPVADASEPGADAAQPEADGSALAADAPGDDALVSPAQNPRESLPSDDSDHSDDSASDDSASNDSASGADDPGRHEEPKVITTVDVVSVGTAESIALALGSLKAVRHIGKAEPLATFGLENLDTSITVVVKGVAHKILLGSTAPGGRDRYIRYEANQEIYAVDNGFIQELEAGETGLNERAWHGFATGSMTRLTVAAGGKTRGVVREGAEGARVWASPASPQTEDKAFVAWLALLERMVPHQYARELPADSTSHLVLRVEYHKDKKNTGFLELYRFPPAEPDIREAKNRWFVRTERTRRYARVMPSLAEPVEEALPTLFP